MFGTEFSNAKLAKTQLVFEAIKYYILNSNVFWHCKFVYTVLQQMDHNDT